VIFAKAYSIEYVWDQDWGEDDPGRLERKVYYYVLKYIEDPTPYWKVEDHGWFAYEHCGYPCIGNVVVNRDRVEIPYPIDPKRW